MNNPNIVPNLENYHLDENGRISFTNSNHTSDVGASTQDQSLNGAHNNHGTDPQSQISSPGGARGRGRGCGCGRGDGRGCGHGDGRGCGGGSGRGRGSKKNSLQGRQRNITFAEQQDEGQTARVDHSSQPNQNTQSSQSNPTTQSSQTPSGQQSEAHIDLNNRISQGSADTKKIHKLAITYELQSEILFKWVGGFNKMKGPNRFNNYCRYGRKPCEIFASKQFPPGERMQQVGEKWRALDESKQLKYTDIDFLNDLRRAMGLPGTDDPEDIEDKDRKEAGQIDAKFNRSAESGNLQINLLASKFNHLRADHQVEGFVIVVSSDSLGSVFMTGGTPLGEEYMDMLKAKYECWKKFHIWVTGMTVDGELNPLGRPIKKLPKRATNLAQAKPWEAGEVPDKKKIMPKALCGKRLRGWPAKAHQLFEKWGLVLKIKPEAVEPSTGVNLRKTLLDGDPSAYSKDQIHAVLEALHFKWILLNKKDPATATGTNPHGLQGTGSEQQVGGKGNKVGSEGNEVGGEGNEVGGEGNEVGGEGKEVGANE
ncbi:hypothetical protein PCANC_02595 [Puccinia coronata f. sp. avenae]|uniref:Uncharacterized protein n=1 Tax=Puccinia coronata f. sp. avenae TaxID=200324 RepID=A0A2N5W5M8_9BASI|nr:hypothetical protein PCANC_02595 [Puccinia coronata f. sp. avenae]